MNEYQRLIAFFKIFQCNLAVLHHNITGSGFFEAHEKLDRWQKESAAHLDDLIERGIALGYQEPTIADAVLQFQTDVLPSDKRERDETYQIIMAGMRTLAGMAQASEAIVPLDVQSKLQELQYYWNKEAGYKLAAALGKSHGHREPDYDDD